MKFERNIAPENLVRSFAQQKMKYLFGFQILTRTEIHEPIDHKYTWLYLTNMTNLVVESCSRKAWDFVGNIITIFME